MELLIWIGEDNETCKKGDIVIVRPDNFYGEPGELAMHGYNHGTFRLVRIPGEPDYSLQTDDKTGPLPRMGHSIDKTLAVAGAPVLIQKKDAKLYDNTKGALVNWLNRLFT